MLSTRSLSRFAIAGFLTVGALLAGQGAQAAQEGPCMGAVEVQALPFEIQKDFTRSLRELNEEASNAKPLAPDAMEMGSVSAKRQARLVELPRREDGCARARLIAGHWALSLRVARELATEPQSCAFQQALAHEREHARLYERHQRELAGSLGEALAREFQARPYDGSPEDQRRVMAVALGALRSVDALHEAFDSPQEHARLGAVCSGALSTLAAKVPK